MGQAELVGAGRREDNGFAPATSEIADGTNVVRVRELDKRYGKTVAVEGVHLSIGCGEIFGLIGPDGCGKSSVMKAVAGVLSYERGKVEVFGLRVDSEAEAERIKHRLGFMPQGLGLNLYPDLSVEENVDFFARLRLVPERELALRKRRLLGITRLERFRDRPMKNLSGGMKQKLGLVCTLIHEPELLILDEPTTGVDPVSRRDFWAILSALVAERKTTVIVSTAYMDEASRFHRMALMYAGRIIAQGSPEDIRSLVPGSQVLVWARTQQDALARLRVGFNQVETLGPSLCVYADGLTPEAAATEVRQTLDGIEVDRIEAGEPDMEDVFIALLRLRGGVSNVERPVLPGSAVAVPRGETAVAIEARSLTRDFGRFRAVDRASFRVSQGEIFGLLGANGAGKTTLIKMLTGLLRPTDGNGRVAGEDMRAAGWRIKERIGYMSQAFSLYTDLTVAENIGLYAGIYGLVAREKRARTEWVLEMAQLAGYETILTGRLPMGLRQRLALGCALVHRPQVLFLDEPTSGVDPLGRRQFWDILFGLSRAEGVAILVTTHYMSEAEHCDRLALMYAGRIVADAPPEALKREVEAKAGAVLAVSCAAPAAAMALLSAAGFGGLSLHGQRVHLFSPSPEHDRLRIAALLAGAEFGAVEVSPRPTSMEDVFIYRVSELDRSEAQA